MIQIGGNIKFPGWSGILQALQNSTTLRASSSGNIIVGTPHALIPEVDSTQLLGFPYLKWANLHSVSGTFDNLTINGVVSNGDPANSNIIYVGKHGSDSNDGLHPDRPFLTIAAAKSQAVTLGVDVNNPYTIEIVDGSVYGECFHIPPYLTVYGPRATISGTIDVGDNSTVDIHQLRVQASGAGETTFGVIRRNSPETPATVSGVSNVRIHSVIAESESFGNGLNVFDVRTSGVLNVDVIGSAHCTSGFLLSANQHGAEIHFRGNEVQLSTGAGLSDGFAVLGGPAVVIADANRIRGDGNERLLQLGGDMASGFISAREIDVQILEFGLSFTNADVRIFAHALHPRTPSFAIGSYSNHCVQDLCGLVNATVHLTQPVDARSVSGQIIPDTDNAYVLGNDQARFGGVHTALLKTSGLLAQDNHAISVSGHLMPGADDTYDLGTSALAWGALHAGSGVFVNVSATIVNTDSLEISSTFSVLGSATSTWSGDINIFGPTSLFGTTLIRTDNFAPDTECNRQLGYEGGVPKPFHAMHAKSGVFTVLHPPIAGTDQNLLVSGHLVPSGSDHFDLGSTLRPWAHINAVSGSFADITLSDDLVVLGDLTVAGTTILSATTVMGTISATAMTAVTAVFGLQAATNSISLGRYETGSAGLGQGSGVAMRNELRWDPHMKGTSEGSDLTFLQMSMDNLNTRTLPIIIRERAVLQDFFGMTAQRTAGGGDEWVVLMRKHLSDGSTEEVASGFFAIPGAETAPNKTLRKWSVSGVAPLEFFPGQCYDVVVHNDGSGTTISGPQLRLSMGWHVNAPDGGTGP